MAYGTHDFLTNAAVEDVTTTTNPSGGTSAKALVTVASAQAGSTLYSNKKPNTVARLVSAAATTNATSVKASAGDVFTIAGYNAAAALRYLKLYNKATAPVVGTDTPFATLPLPASSGFAFDFPSLFMDTGIAYALTTGVADADAVALTAGDVLALNIVYQ